MLYWLNNKNEKDNVVILTKIAIVVGSCDPQSYAKADAQFKNNANPIAVLGKENVKVIPLQRVQGVESQVSTPEITLGIQLNAGKVVKKTINFSDFSAREKCYLYLQKLTQGSQQNTAQASQAQAGQTKPQSTASVSSPSNANPKVKADKNNLGTATSQQTQEKETSKTKAKIPAINKKMAIMGAVLVALGGGILAAYLTFFAEKPSSLYEAIQSDNVASTDIDKYLTEGADINYQGDDGVTPLLSAINHGKEDLVVTLVKKGADLDDDYSGETALDIAIASGLNKAVTTMLDKNAPSQNSDDLLIRAIQNKLSLESLNKIISLGSDVNYVNDNGSSVLATALLFGAKNDVVKVLLERGASTSIHVNGVSPVKFAQSKGNMQLASLLTQY